MTTHPRRIATLIAIVAAISLLTAACGDSTTEVGTPSNDPATTATPATTQAPTTTSEKPLGAGPYPIADLTFAIHPDGIASAASAGYRLSCLGDTATVTGDAPNSAAMMCLALNQPDVRGLLINGPATDGVCTEIYGGPNVTLITGRLDDTDVDTIANRINGCAISDWDLTFAALLPAA